MPIDWLHLTMLAVGLVGGAVATRIKSGAAPVVDPNNQRPAVDMIRDQVRAEILAMFGGNPPAPVPKPAAPIAPINPASPIDLNALIQQLTALNQQALSHLAALQQATPSTAPAPSASQAKPAA